MPGIWRLKRTGRDHLVPFQCLITTTRLLRLAMPATQRLIGEVAAAASKNSLPRTFSPGSACQAVPFQRTNLSQAVARSDPMAQTSLAERAVTVHQVAALMARAWASHKLPAYCRSSA